MSPLNLLENGARHVLIALRTLFRHKGVYFSAIGILALGIGMSVAMFSLVDAVLLRPLPFPEQELIQVIWKTDPAAGAPFVELAYPELRDLQENIHGFQYVAVMPTTLYGYGKVLQAGNADPVQVESTPVSHDFFRVLGVSPVLGRDFTSSDEQVGAAPVVVVSDWVWRAHLGANRNIVGQMIRLNGQGHTVIGVMARGVDFPRGAGLWIPLGIDRRVVERRTATFLQAIARVKTWLFPCKFDDASEYALCPACGGSSRCLLTLAAGSGDSNLRVLDGVGAPSPVDHAGSIAAAPDCRYDQRRQSVFVTRTVAPPRDCHALSAGRAASADSIAICR